MSGMKVIADRIRKDVEARLSRAQNAQAWLNRVAYRKFQNRQLNRWMTSNKAEGSKWKDNQGWYKAWKRKAYGGGARFVNGGLGNGRWVQKGNYPNYPGSGKFVMMATSSLVQSVTGQPIEGNRDGLKYHRKVVAPKSMEIFTSIEYAKDANDERNFTDFRADFYKGLIDNYKNWLNSGDYGRP
jgi:hypothetical protein